MTLIKILYPNLQPQISPYFEQQIDVFVHPTQHNCYAVKRDEKGKIES